MSTTEQTDYMADYREAQAGGHHADCDGWMTSHRVSIVRTAGGFSAGCEECGPLHIGSFGQERDCSRHVAGHSQEVRCDGRCKDW